MIRHCIFIATFWLSLAAVAEDLRLDNFRQLTADSQSIAPVFSPVDGNLIAFSKDKYQGIYLLHMARSRGADGSESVAVAAVSPLNESGQSGFGFSWTGSGEHIVFRAGEDTRQAGMVNVRTKESVQLSEPGAEVSVPTAHDRGIFFTKAGQGSRVPLPGMRLSAATGPVIEESNGAIHVAGEKVNPGTCWLPRLSPDGEKLCFECWEGLYVYHLATRQRYFLGRGTSPVWSADSARLVYEQTRDDGHRVTAADIYMTDYEGKHKQLLTGADARIVRRPSLSPDGKQMAVDIDGNIYLADVVGE